jgi:hypothetical protein
MPLFSIANSHDILYNNKSLFSYDLKKNKQQGKSLLLLDQKARARILYITNFFFFFFFFFLVLQKGIIHIIEA